MFWGDQLLQNRTGKEWINDAWTPSGIIHMGGLKGPIIHDTIYKILKEQGKDVKYTFGFDDLDPIDGLPANLRESHGQYMGIPICNAPSPDGNGTFADYYSNMMRELFFALDIEAEIYLGSEYYRNGVYNKAIEFVLNNADKVRKVYSDMYKKEIPDTWFPFQVVCSECGKLGSTKVTGWDGSDVLYVCEPNLVKWAQGCGNSGKISPFDGNGKMPFKVEWAAKWWTFGVTIEGAGKDHASAGGTYDVARRIVKDVFGQEPPLWLPYEFFLYGGKKMASSKGIGLTGQELLEVVPPQIVRFLMTKTPPNQSVEFNPNGTLIIPKLYDDYQKAEESDEDYETRPLQLSKVHGKSSESGVRFLTLAQWVQMPNMRDEIKANNGEEWAPYARVWVEKYAPESETFLIQKDLPEVAKNLNSSQKEYLTRVAKELEKDWNGEDLQTQLYEWSKEMNVSSKDAFSAIYTSLIGKNHGPKAGWLVLTDKEFVKKRFMDVARQEQQVEGSAAKITSFNKSEIFRIDNRLKVEIPSLSVGVAVIKGVSIKKSTPELEQEKQAFISSFSEMTTEELGQFPEVIAYRNLYKSMGIDWHSRRPSPEALLRRIALKKGLYTINTCVDAYNLIVMKNRVSIGAFDLDTLEMPTLLRYAHEGETILLLGDEEETNYKPSEIAYFDKRGGFNIDFNYRDAQRTAVQLETKNLYVNVDGVFDITPEMVQKSLQEACDKIVQYCGGEVVEFGVETAS